MRLVAIIAVLGGLAITASVVVLAIPTPLYLAAGVLFASGMPRALRRDPPRWVARVKTGSLVDEGTNPYGQRYVGLHIECVKRGKKPIWIGGVDVCEDDHENLTAQLRSKAEDRAAFLNAVTP